MKEPFNTRDVNPVNGMIQMIARVITAALAFFLIVISIPLLFLPIPLGLPLFIIAMILLAATSKRACGVITGWLQRHPAVWSRVKPIFDRFHKDDGERD